MHEMSIHTGCGTVWHRTASCYCAASLPGMDHSVIFARWRQLPGCHLIHGFIVPLQILFSGLEVISEICLVVIAREYTVCDVCLAGFVLESSTLHS